jgi:alpha-aminoadipic semialdehyde synthase
MNCIGIRHEDKSKWQARVPLVPADIKKLIGESKLSFCVENSSVRAFVAADYQEAGATVTDDLSSCSIIMGVKEIPAEKFLPGRTYVNFSHTIKGQSANMPVLARLMELGCSLIDYEKIVDEQGRRHVFFGRFAGLAGMVDTLWTLGRRYAHEGIDTPFARVKPSHQYQDLDEIRVEMKSIRDEIQAKGLPEAILPFVCGFAGYGQVSKGAQEIYDLLGVTDVDPADLDGLDPDAKTLYKVVFEEKHMAAPLEEGKAFELNEYYEHPERFRGTFFQYADKLSLLMNCIYWEERYPRLIDKDQFKQLWADGAAKLTVLGDISCDIDGALACTTRATGPSNPVYVYDPTTGETIDGVEGHGPVVQAVDFLPCELPVDASTSFSAASMPYMANLAAANFEKPFDESGLDAVWKRATIVYQGELTDAYEYLREYLD